MNDAGASVSEHESENLAHREVNAGSSCDAASVVEFVQARENE